MVGPSTPYNDNTVMGDILSSLFPNRKKFIAIEEVSHFFTPILFNFQSVRHDKLEKYSSFPEMLFSFPGTSQAAILD